MYIGNINLKYAFPDEEYLFLLVYGLTQRESTLLAVYSTYSTRQLMLQYVQLSNPGNNWCTVPCGMCGQCTMRVGTTPNGHKLVTLTGTLTLTGLGTPICEGRIREN